LTEIDNTTLQAQSERIAELEAEVARFKTIERGLELAATHAQRVTARLQSILDTTIDAIITIDDRGIIQTANPATEAMFGYAEAEMAGKNVRILMPEPDRARHDSYLGAYNAGGPAKMIGTGRTTSAMRKDGSLFPIDLSVSEANVEGHRVYTGIIRDVTERTSASERIAQYGTLFDAAPIGVTVNDVQRSIVAVNPALQHMLGRAEEEFLGKRLTSFMHPGYDQHNLGSHDRLIDGVVQQVSYDRVLQHADGSPVWAQVTAAAIVGTDGSPQGIVRLVQDVTAQHYAEADRLAQEELLRTIVEHAPLGIALVAEDTYIVKTNPALQQMLDRSSPQIEGHRMREFLDTNEVPANLRGRFDGGQIEHDQRERIFNKPDGTQLAAQVTSAAVRTDDGSIRYFVRLFQDITQSKASASELLASEAKYRALFEAAPIGLLIKDADNRIVSSNSQAQAMFGRAGDDMTGARVRDYWLPGFSQPQTGQPQRMVKQEIDAFEAEAHLVRPDGTAFWVHASQSAVRDADGTFLYAIQSFEDITARREYARTLEASEERFRLLFESSPLGIVVSGPDRTIERVNPALSQILGYSEQDLHGHRLTDYRYPGYAISDTSSGDRIRSGDSYPAAYERQFQHADGSSIWAKMTANALSFTEDEPPSIVRTVDDITVEKKAIAELRSSETRFRSLFDSTPVGIALVAEDATITTLNPALEQLLGYPIDEVVGKTLAQFRSPNDTGTGQHRALGLAESSAASYVSERLQLHKDGSEVWTQVVTAPVRDDQGQFLFGVRMIVDISERKQVEKMKDEFLGMVSHELRTPLTAIEAGVGLVASGALGPLPEKIQHMLDIAAENSDRLTRLVNDVLDLERMSAGRMILEPIECHASVLIEQAAHAAGAVAAASDVTIETSSADPLLFADPDRIVQTLINLTANAVKFSPPGSTVSVGVESVRDGIRFSVSDHGRGISANQINLVFDRFHQVETGDARIQGGTGLGLAISQWIVEEHGGRIWVESEIGKGSTFSFEIPLRR
jgi:PAS domain S-box-containing protein